MARYDSGVRYGSGARYDEPDAPAFTPKLKHSSRPYHMNDRQRNQVQRLLRVEGFCANHAASFTNTPPKNGDAKFAAARAGIIALRTQITGKQAVQAGGGFGQATAQQEVERQELTELLRSVNRTAGAIAEEKEEPGLMDRFRMPRGNNDAELAARGDAFADAIVELELADEFAANGYEGDLAADLRKEAKDVRDTESDQGGALSVQAGVTAVLPGLLRVARKHVTTLDAVLHNRFGNDAEVLGAWKTASHVTAPPSGGGETVPPATPPPAPPPTA